MENKGSILALDYGGKRTGIAITDPLQMIASPVNTVATQNLMQELENLFFTEKVVELVIGQAHKSNGEPASIEEEIVKFITRFKKKYPQILVARQDESFTSRMASIALVQGGMPKKKRQQKGALDKVSAAIILQSYLEQKT